MLWGVFNGNVRTSSISCVCFKCVASWCVVRKEIKPLWQEVQQRENQYNTPYWGAELETVGIAVKHMWVWACRTIGKPPQFHSIWMPGESWVLDTSSESLFGEDGRLWNTLLIQEGGVSRGEGWSILMTAVSKQLSGSIYDKKESCLTFLTALRLSGHVHLLSASPPAPRLAPQTASSKLIY